MAPPAKLKPVKPAAASEPAAFALADAEAVQALMRADATPEQQKRGMNWILNNACALSTWGYRENERETAVALGRQFVGQQIVGIARVNLAQMRKSQ